MNELNGMKSAFLEDVAHIRWSQLRPDTVPEAVGEALKNAEAQIQAIADQEPSGATFVSTFLALEEADEVLTRAWGRVCHLDSVCNSNALRKVYNEWLPKVSAFHAQIPLNANLWAILKRVAEDNAALSELSAVERRLVEKTTRQFRQNGAELEPAEKERFEEIKKALVEKTQKFSENVLDATNAFELIVEEEDSLAGLPQMAKEAARASAIAKAKEKREAGELFSDGGEETSEEQKPAWRFTLQAPSLMPVLQYLDDDGMRKTLWEAFSRVGREEPYANGALVEEILALRQEMAELLGYAHFADRVLESRMAKNGEEALTFVEDLHKRIRDQFRQEIHELEAFKAETTGEPVDRLEPWELAYWSEKLRRARYDFDAEALRPYFAIGEVLGGMFRLAEELFGIRLEERQVVCREKPSENSVSAEGEIEVWHEEVTFYDVFDQGGEHLGGFYADWHPRESKRGGAWMNYLKTGLPPEVTRNGVRKPHIGLICGNLTPSVDGKPALLTHGEVETIFHEFGHLLHHLLGNVAIKSLNGVNVVWDFVELPSQLMENFCWERISLDRFARHHETGEPIPEELFQKMLAARHFQAAMVTMRQLCFGKMDLELHLHFQDLRNRAGGLDAAIDSVIADYQVPTRTPRPNTSHSFGHLFSSPMGYAAGYYSYKWAEVLDADAFTRFQKDGVLSAAVGREFREQILSQGNARDAGELFRSFMGRDPDLNALLRRSGLVA